MFASPFGGTFERVLYKYKQENQKQGFQIQGGNDMLVLIILLVVFYAPLHVIFQLTKKYQCFDRRDEYERQNWIYKNGLFGKKRCFSRKLRLVGAGNNKLKILTYFKVSII